MEKQNSITLFALSGIATSLAAIIAPAYFTAPP